MGARTVSCAIATAIAIGCLSWVATPATAQDGPSCSNRSQPGAPVFLIVLASPSRVRAYAATVKNEEVIRQDQTTIIFGSGRVVTSDVAAAGEQLNALGWANRKLEIVASFPARRARPRSYG